jgi:hypothetical protein
VDPITRITIDTSKPDISTLRLFLKREFIIYFIIPPTIISFILGLVGIRLFVQSDPITYLYRSSFGVFYPLIYQQKFFTLRISNIQSIDHEQLSTPLGFPHSFLILSELRSHITFFLQNTLVLYIMMFIVKPQSILVVVVCLLGFWEDLSLFMLFSLIKLIFGPFLIDHPPI